MSLSFRFQSVPEQSDRHHFRVDVVWLELGLVWASQSLGHLVLLISELEGLSR